MGNAYTVNLGISGICSESIPMGRLKNETTERYEQLVIPGYLIAKNDTVLAPIAQVTRQPVKGGGCLLPKPTVYAQLSKHSSHLLPAIAVPTNLFPDFFLEKLLTVEAAASSPLFLEVKARATPGPAAILYQGLMDLQQFKEKNEMLLWYTLVIFFLTPPKKNVNVGWLTQKTTSLVGHFLSEFAWGKLIKSTKSTAVMCTCFLNSLIFFTDFHLPILPFRRTWHPIFNGVVFTPMKPNHIQCPSHRDGDRQGDTLHSSLFLFSDVR